MGWIQYPSKATITAGLKAADPAAAAAAKGLADLMIAHLERLSDPDAVSSMVYSALTRTATDAAFPFSTAKRNRTLGTPEGKNSSSPRYRREGVDGLASPA